VVDWDAALSVAITGIVSVFIVLGVLSLVVNLTGTLLNKTTNKQKDKVQLEK